MKTWEKWSFTEAREKLFRPVPDGCSLYLGEGGKHQLQDLKTKKVYDFAPYHPDVMDWRNANKEKWRARYRRKNGLLVPTNDQGGWGGWEDTCQTTGGPWNAMGADCYVPANPSTAGGTFLYFIGLDDGNNLLQPELWWANAGGWSVRCEALNSLTVEASGSPTASAAVSASNFLQMGIYYLSGWHLTVIGYASLAVTSIDSTVLGTTMPYAIAVKELHPYSVCTDIQTGFEFDNVNLNSGVGAVNWSGSSGGACSAGVTIYSPTTNGSTILNLQ